MYRFTRTGDTVKLAWRTEYPIVGTQARAFNSGTGTTPTLMGDDYVVIVDGLSPMRVHVYSQIDGKEVASAKMFKGVWPKAVENSVIVHGNRMMVTNSAGYQNPLLAPTENPPGGAEGLILEGNVLRNVWATDAKMFTATPQLSSNGLIYAYSGEYKNRKWDWAIIGTKLRNRQRAVPPHTRRAEQQPGLRQRLGHHLNRLHRHDDRQLDRLLQNAASDRRSSLRRNPRPPHSP